MSKASAYQQYADTMKRAGVQTLSGKGTSAYEKAQALAGSDRKDRGRDDSSPSPSRQAATQMSGAVGVGKYSPTGQVLRPVLDLEKADPGLRKRLRMAPNTQLPGILGLGQNMARDIFGDLSFGFNAGLFSNFDKQRTNLLAPGMKEKMGYGMYDDEVYAAVVDDYINATKATMERNSSMPRDRDEQMSVVDPCPEGYEMGPEGVCVLKTAADDAEEDFYPDDLLVAKALDPAALTPYTQPLPTLGVPVTALLPGNIFSESDPYYNYYT